MDPTPYDGLPFMLMGTLLIVFRRPWARHFVKYWRSWDRAYNEDGVVWVTVLIGGLMFLSGASILLLWLTA